MGTTPADSRSGPIGNAMRSLRGDPVVLVTLAVAAAAMLGLALAPEMRRSTFVMRCVTSAFLAILIFALWHDLARIRRELERRFWGRMVAAYSIWLLTDLILIAFAGGEMPVAAKLAVQLGFVCYCVAVVYAVESQVHRRRSSDELERLRLLAIVLFVFGLLIYFDLIPQRIPSPVPESEPSSMWLFATVDAYVGARFGYLAWTSRTRRWRMIYSILAAAISVTALGDVIGSLQTRAEANIFYSLTAVLLILAARLKNLHWPAKERPARDLAFSEPGWQTIVYALVFPVMHFLLYRIDLLAAVYRPARETIVLLWILLLGTIALIQQHRQTDRRRELQAKSSELESFAYTVSHDLKSPLFTIQGFLGMLRKDIASGNADRISADIERISGAARKMGRFVDELLDLSRLGKIVGEPQAVPLDELAREAVAQVSGRLSEGGIEVRISPDLPVVLGDRTRLLQVLQNLLDNAIKFIGTQPQPRIEISARRDGGEAICHVRDNGIGIDPSQHQEVFGLFGQLEPGGEGAGIGLALVLRIIESHGGRIWIESEGSGQGSTFCFTLPRSMDDVLSVS